MILAQAVEHVPGTPIEWSWLVPELVLVGGALALLVISAIVGKLPRGVYAGATVVVGLVSFSFAWVDWFHVRDDGPQALVGGALSLDGFSVFFMIAITSALILAALLCNDYLEREQLEGAEPYALMIISAVGGIVMAAANDLIVLFLGLETLSIALYVLAAVHRRRIQSQESAIKYFVLGGFSSAFLLYGIAMVYGATGSTNMTDIAVFLRDNVLLEHELLLAGMALLLVGLGFKVAAVPFHTWTPDVYQGAPTPITGFMASAAKAAGFAGMLRLFYLTFETYSVDWRPIVFVLAVATLVVGSVAAVVQTNVKRMMAYSSISHAGFVLVGLQAASRDGTAGSLFYLLAYTFMVLGTFGVVTLVGRRGDAAHDLDDYRGLAKARPVLAAAFTVFLLAQAGVPLTSGFLAKFEVIGAAVDSESYALAIIAMVSSVVAAFLYLRIIVAMFLADPPASEVAPVKVPWAAGIAIGLAAIFTIGVGVVPDRVVHFAHEAVPALVADPR